MPRVSNGCLPAIPIWLLVGTYGVLLAQMRESVNL